MKRFLPELLVILAFIIISFAYFFPAVLEGCILFQHDTAAGAGASQEVKEYYERTGHRSRWTNALFGGMPTYQISPSYDSTEPLRLVEKAYHLFLPNYVWLVFAMMLGFYILLRVMGVSAWLAGLGGIIWGFSSYFFILISAGHIWKFITLAYIPPTIAGILLAYKKKYLAGGILAALFVALQIQSNHIQMTYYFLFVILFLVIAIFIDAWKKKELTDFLKATGTLIVAGFIGISINLSTLYHTYEYTKETMRGQSELRQETTEGKEENGLTREYITQWSYGIGETFNLLVPNLKGGASVPLSQSRTAMKKANPMYISLYSQLPQYFGDQPMTSGPVYIGAFVLMLFILGCFLVKGPVKWALLGATIFSVLLSWGKNFMGLTDFFIDYVPLYDKFRAISSILVIAEFTIPLLAVLAIKEIVQQPGLLKEKAKYLYISFALTGGLCFLFAIAPRLFFSSYIPAQEFQALQNAIPADQLKGILSNLEEMRVYLFTSDAWRSSFIIVIGTLLLWIYRAGKLKTTLLIGAIAILCLTDLWAINKRYLNDAQFQPQTQKTETFRKTPTDDFILQDPSLDYRVLNFATSTFQENYTSYWHKSVGGYHAAKLQRYQDMIDWHIVPEMSAVYEEIQSSEGDVERMDPDRFRILNMLNTRYFIFPATHGQTIPLENPYAYGNAWYVSEIRYVNSATEEMEGLNDIDPAETALVNDSFRDALSGITESYKDSLASVTLTSYEPDHLVYKSSSEEKGVIVFSEIYYPGWEATIDGISVPIARADYILRAIEVPAGEHTIEMRFTPKSLKITETIAYVALVILLLAVIAWIWKQRKNVLNSKKTS
ncbi:MAG: YfhO family protein [Bacteroides sp.]|nr:YfhO family protein [Bacteroides sp.]